MAFKIVQELYCSYDPQTGDEIATFPLTQPSDISTIVEKARSAFADWGDLSLKTRIEIVKKAYRQFYLAQDEVAELISRETGKPIAEAYSSEILPVLDCFKYYLKHIHRFLKNKSVQFTNPIFKLRQGYVRQEPLGVVAIISPWNFPFLLTMQHLVPAILTGNVVIHKPSEHTSLVGLKIREIFDRSYLPKNVLVVVTGLADVGSALVESNLDKIFFTGSTDVGKKIYRAAANNFVPVNMELGGSDPMIVLKDADLDRAVNAAVWGAFNNCGQACVSVERLYIDESILDEFVARMLEKMKNLRFKTPENPDAEISCLAIESQFLKIKRMVEDAVTKGAVVLSGGKNRQELGGWFYEPTVLTNIDSSMTVMKYEIFGPLVLVIPFISEGEAVFLANDSQYGLSASVWTEDRKRGEALAKKIEAGSVLINDIHIHVAQMEAPYTGFKNSGFGVGHGYREIMELVKPKYINTERPFIKIFFKIVFRSLIKNDLWWFKYSDQVKEELKTFIAFLHHSSYLKRILMLPAVVRALFRKNYL